MDTKEAKEKASEAIKAGKEKFGETFSKENIEAGKEKLKAGTAEVKKRISLLPFRSLAEKKIPQSTREKFPILNRLIPLANQIACGMAVFLVVVFIACSPKAAKSAPAYSGSPDIDSALGALEGSAKNAVANIAEKVAGGSKSTEEKASQSAVKGNAAPASDFKYDLSSDGKGIVILEYIGKGGNVIVPSEIEGMPVIQLGRLNSRDFGFERTKVTGVVLPDTIELKLDSSSGYNPGFASTPLQSITFPKGLAAIPGMFFQYCKSLKSIDIPDTVRVIGSAAFRESGLTSIVIPEGVELIGSYAFSLCKDLKSVTLPESIREIRLSAFEGCSSLETVNLPSHKISYDEGFDVFDGCTKLSIATRKAINDSGYTGKFTN
jgi:hypothetical protein